MPTLDEWKQKQRLQWEESAAGWEKWSTWYEANFRGLNDWYCAAVGAAPGRRILDLGCGTGEPLLELARRTTPGGSVLGGDLSPAMLAAAERRVRAAGHAHVELREMDAEALPLGDRSLDGVTFGFGLMFCPDAARVLAEIRRVLRPGGCFALTVWDEAPRNPFFTVIGGTLGSFLGAPPPDPDGPTGFRFAPPGKLESVIRVAGFTDFTLESLPLTIELDSVDDYWTLITDFSPGLRRGVASLADGKRAEARQALAAAAAPYLAGGRLRLPAAALCASGTA